VSPLRLTAALVATMLVVSGCATRRPAPVEDRALERTAPPSEDVATPLTPAPPGTAQSPPVPTYTVKRGDTLHQIALDTGLDYRELAAWNNIENVNVIRVGQVLRLSAPGEALAVTPDAPVGVTTAPLRALPPVVEAKPGTGAAVPPAAGPVVAPPHAAAALGGNLKTSPRAVKEPYSDHAVRELTLAASAGPAPPDALAMATPPGPRVEPRSELRSAPKSEPRTATPPPAPSANAPASAGDGDQLDWAWPTKGRIIAGFSDTANLKGIDIAGTAGQAVHASAPGRVVYAGNGLRGYGKLIIIKHNATYLSAYAHNREILVKEGQQVTRGQKIAEMGNTDADQVKLHFEIRRQGRPMDPARYLPPA
jgi:lipoprotein NlpD